MTDRSSSLLIGINIMKRVIERLSTSQLATDEQSQQDALDIANVAIEELFALVDSNGPERE